MDAFDPALFFLLWILLIVVLIVLDRVWHVRRAHSMLEAWARTNGYRIVHQRYAWVNRGAFFWTTSGNQVVYQVVVEDNTGRQRSGWVRLGSYFLGTLSSKVEVRWDDAS